MFWFIIITILVDILLAYKVHCSIVFSTFCTQNLALKVSKNILQAKKASNIF